MELSPVAEADRRLETAKISPNQVQVAWIKLANVKPTGELADHVGLSLLGDVLAYHLRDRKRVRRL